jgi:hypothetical protein
VAGGPACFSQVSPVGPVSDSKSQSERPGARAGLARGPRRATRRPPRSLCAQRAGRVRRHNHEGRPNETSPPTIFASGRGCCGASGAAAYIASASLSDAAGAYPRRVSCGWADRHYSTPDRSMAVGTTRPAVRHREPPRGNRQYCYRGSSSCGWGRVHSDLGGCLGRDKRNALSKSQLHFYSRTSRPLPALYDIPT